MSMRHHFARMRAARELDHGRFPPWSCSVKYLSKVAAVTLFGLVLAGCNSAPMNTQHYDSSQYTVLGHSEASATGLLLFGVIPIRQNSRFVRAQDEAIKAKG